MPVQIRNAPDNDVRIPEDFLANQGGIVTFTGKGGSIEIGADCYAAQINLTIGDGCAVRIGNGCRLGAITIHTVRDSTVSIGDLTGFTWTCNMQCHESFDISIGNGSLFAGGTWITVSDMHSVVDVASGRRINPGGNVQIGDRVWVGDGAAILKGCSIGAGSVIAARALVSKSVPAQCVAAGVPARVVRTGTSWDFRLLPVEVETEEVDPAPRRAGWFRRLLDAARG
ncbi:acyltransferase [Sphingobium sp.]|uniref:acyltransferase n=1 Tax=Sphingobium TaxID=165695 RepID=UPI001A193712|nr:acyltransferase [Sphingobium sp.]MBJ7377441.1 acyltransferase [Sphingobium sp.]